MEGIILASDNTLWEGVRRFSNFEIIFNLSISRQNTLVARRSRGAMALGPDSRSAHVPDPAGNY